MSDLSFGKVALTYNEHIANLDTARGTFEAEAGRFNEQVHEWLEERAARSSAHPTIRWSQVEDRSNTRDVTWLNFRAATWIRLDARPSNDTKRNFKRGVAWLTFEIRYEHDDERFMFKATFENQNRLSSDLDEQLYSLVQRNPEKFPRAYQTKMNTCVLFRLPLDAELTSRIKSSMDAAIDLVENAVHQVRVTAASAEPVTEEIADPPSDAGLPLSGPSTEVMSSAQQSEPATE